MLRAEDQLALLATVGLRTCEVADRARVENVCPRRRVASGGAAPMASPPGNGAGRGAVPAFEEAAGSECCVGGSRAGRGQTILSIERNTIQKYIRTDILGIDGAPITEILEKPLNKLEKPTKN